MDEYHRYGEVKARLTIGLAGHFADRLQFAPVEDCNTGR
jgi:hypothetical protein